MTEKQNVEYKIAWRDEYLKWICGFANAQGGIKIMEVGYRSRSVFMRIRCISGMTASYPMPGRCRNYLTNTLRFPIIPKLPMRSFGQGILNRGAGGW